MTISKYNSSIFSNTTRTFSISLMSLFIININQNENNNNNRVIFSRIILNIKVRNYFICNYWIISLSIIIDLFIENTNKTSNSATSVFSDNAKIFWTSSLHFVIDVNQNENGKNSSVIFLRIFYRMLNIFLLIIAKLFYFQL